VTSSGRSERHFQRALSIGLQGREWRLSSVRGGETGQYRGSSRWSWSRVTLMEQHQLGGDGKRVVGLSVGWMQDERGRDEVKTNSYPYSACRGYPNSCSPHPAATPPPSPLTKTGNSHSRETSEEAQLHVCCPGAGRRRSAAQPIHSFEARSKNLSVELGRVGVRIKSGCVLHT
jgi:hypothetical protein